MISRLRQVIIPKPHFLAIEFAKPAIGAPEQKATLIPRQIRRNANAVLRRDTDLAAPHLVASAEETYRGTKIGKYDVESVPLVQR